MVQSVIVDVIAGLIVAGIVGILALLVENRKERKAFQTTVTERIAEIREGQRSLIREKNLIVAEAQREHQRMHADREALEETVERCQSQCKARAEAYARQSEHIANLDKKTDILEIAMGDVRSRMDELKEMINGLRVDLARVKS